MNTYTKPTPPSLASQIASLPQLPMAEIKALWQKLFETDIPKGNRKSVERRIAYRLQEIEYRKTHAATLVQNQYRITTLLEAEKAEKAGKQNRIYRPIPGTELTREYHGKAYRVIVTADGQYDFQGRMYRSLSVIAREIQEFGYI
ncbi:conserved hypothetical protein [Gammaproteobacteria bacterium]